MKAWRGALLGFGHMAEFGHLPAWRRCAEVTLVAFADPDPERRRRAGQLLPEARGYEDAAELLARENLDFVDITTPPAMHVPMIVAAASHGCHVLCEKPLTTSVPEYQRAVQAVRAAGVTLFTVHNWKHSPPFEKVAAMVAEGKLGRLRSVRMETVRNGPSVTVGSDWRRRAATAGGGILVDHGWHALYLLPALVAEAPLRVRAITEKRRFVDADVEDTATCRIEFPSAQAEIFLTWAGAERRTRWQLIGDLAALELEERELRLTTNGETQTEVLPQSLSTGSHHPEWFSPVIDTFLRAADERTAQAANLAEAEQCLMLLTLAYRSAARHGEALALPGRLAELDLGPGAA